MVGLRTADKDTSTADLIRRGTDQVSTLIRDELTLARAEIRAKITHAGLGAGLFGGAGLIALYGVFGLLTAAVIALALVIPWWAAALVVGGGLLMFAGLLALVGWMQIRRGVPPVPTETVQRMRTDIDTVTRAAQEREVRER